MALVVYEAFVSSDVIRTATKMYYSGDCEKPRVNMILPNGVLQP
ncbi:hypothetical protein GCM10023195_38050 [Actinoallomurus liliacearum]|uniref:Uncharacterized protein n=1 Tax=Actinoallomurus liliacearum TaxID=1080073 RepID=A0ABP8TN30_9ACTN